jgi:hypothetical protein
VQLQHHDAVITIEMARQLGAHAVCDIGAHRVEQFDVAPWPHRMHGRAPARHMTKQRGAHRAQRRRHDHARLPAYRPALRAQPRMHRAEAKVQHVVAGQFHFHLVRGEHVPRGQHLRAVEPDLGQCRQTIEAQQPASVALEMQLVPVVMLMQWRRRSVVPAACGTQGARDGTRHRCRQPVTAIIEFARMRDRVREGFQQGPVAFKPRIGPRPHRAAVSAAEPAPDRAQS